MPATAGAMLIKVQGSSLQNAFAQLTGNGVGPQNLDLLQIVVPGDNASSAPPVVLLNVDYTGAVHNPAVSPTNGTRIGVFQSPLISGGTTAQYFAAAFTNPQLQDIIHVRNIGGNISYYLSATGVATGS